MNKIVIHALKIDLESEKYVRQIKTRLEQEGASVSYTLAFEERNPHLIPAGAEVLTDISSAYDVVFSLGGDGTFLESLLLVGPSEVPILGINLGRLGFLASIAKDYIASSLQLFFDASYEIERRTLISMHSTHDLFEGKCYALNECAILRKDLSSMIMIKCFINDEYLNTYWSDGLMVSTPTGSTGYSLSCGGPLMMPDAKNFIITPVSPHNLNVRPLIVSDDSKLRFQITTRDRKCLISLDSRSETLQNDVEIEVQKAAFYGKLVRIKGISFPQTIRNKLGWGFDKRN